MPLLISPLVTRYTKGMKLTAAERTLQTLDPILGTLITQHGTLPLRPTRGYFEDLARSIVSQQISVKAAAKIFERFTRATDLQPEKVLELTDTDIKTIGLSDQKSRYLHDLAQHFVDDQAVLDHLETLSDDDVIGELTRVKGIGTWTAQMFLIFTLHRPDIFAPDDRGLQLAVEKLYEHTFTHDELAQFAERWAPYRSTACLHLWHSLDNKPQ